MTDSPAPAPEPTDLMKEYKSYGPVAKGILWTAVSLGALYLMSAGCRHIGAGSPSQLERKVQNAQPAGTAPGNYTKSP